MCFEAVTGPANRSEVGRVVGIVLYLLPEAPDVDIDRTGSNVLGVAPNGIEELIAGEYAPGVANKPIKQAKLGGSGGNAGTTNTQDHGSAVDFEVADAGDTRNQGRIEAAENGFHPSYQLSRTERLGDVVIGAEFQAENAIGLAGPGGQENDRSRGGMGVTANAAAKIEAITPGNHDIQQE